MPPAELTPPSAAVSPVIRTTRTGIKSGAKQGQCDVIAEAGRVARMVARTAVAGVGERRGVAAWGWSMACGCEGVWLAVVYLQSYKQIVHIALYIDYKTRKHSLLSVS